MKSPLRNLFLLVLSILAIGPLAGQDLLIPLEGESIQGDISRVGRWLVKYEDLSSGKTKRIPTYELELVIFESGMKQYFQIEQIPVMLVPSKTDSGLMVVSSAQVSSDSIGYWQQLGRQHASESFEGWGAFWGAAACAAVPIFGLYTSLPGGIIIAAVPPKVDVGDLEHPRLFTENQYYESGFRQQARRIKVKRTAAGFGTGLLIQGVVTGIILLLTW